MPRRGLEGIQLAGANGMTDRPETTLADDQDEAFCRGFATALEQAASVAKHMGRAASKGVTRQFAGPADQGEQTAAAILKIEESYLG